MNEECNLNGHDNDGNINPPLFAFRNSLWLFYMNAWFGSGFGMLLGQIFPFNISIVIAFIVPIVMGMNFSGAFPTLGKQMHCTFMNSLLILLFSSDKIEGTWQELVTYLSYNRYAVESATVFEYHSLPPHLQQFLGRSYIDLVRYDYGKIVATLLLFF